MKKPPVVWRFFDGRVLLAELGVEVLGAIADHARELHIVCL